VRDSSLDIGLALGGGGARGFAHILALEALDELGVRPRLISGSSVGALLGAAYASGLSAAEIRAHVCSLLTNPLELVDRLFPNRMESLNDVLRFTAFDAESVAQRILPDGTAKDFASLLIPLKIVSTDFYTQGPVILDSGSLTTAVAASMALPAIFHPVQIGDHVLLDGGMTNPLPFDLLTGRTSVTVAVDVSGGHVRRHMEGLPSPMEVVLGSSQIMQNAIVRAKLALALPDIILQPDVTRFRVLEFYKVEEILRAAAPIKDELKRRLEQFSRVNL